MNLSVIICTHNRAHAIGSCLDSVAKSVRHSGVSDIEIVVVNNASQDETGHLVGLWSQGNADLNLRLIDESRKGLSRARNAGLRVARGKILAFTDDDCHLSETYIAEALAYAQHDQTPTVRSGSVLLGNPEDLPLTINTNLVARAWVYPAPLADEGDILGSRMVGCNMVIPRSVCNKVGLFDERLGAGTTCYASEDSDYFYRAYLQGFRLEAVPDMIVTHYHGRRTAEQGRRLLKQYAIGNGALIAKYLLVYPRFSKHLLWSMKRTITEIVSQDRRRPAYQLSEISMLILNLQGMLRFSWATIFSGRTSLA